VLRPFAAPEGTDGHGVERKVSFCRHCVLYDTGQKEGRFEGAVYAQKEWCRRCGKVISYAIYNQSGDAATGRRALAWAKAPEEV
jgi:hypothetical protein